MDIRIIGYFYTMKRTEKNTKNTEYRVKEVSKNNFQVILYNYATGSTLAIIGKGLRTEEVANEIIDWVRKNEKNAILNN